MPSSASKKDSLSFTPALLFRFRQRHQADAVRPTLRTAREPVLRQSPSHRVSPGVPERTLSLPGLVAHAGATRRGRLRDFAVPVDHYRLARGMEVSEPGLSLLFARCRPCLAIAGR